jgi:hypothetical protein
LDRNGFVCHINGWNGAMGPVGLRVGLGRHHQNLLCPDCTQIRPNLHKRPNKFLPLPPSSPAIPRNSTSNKPTSNNALNHCCLLCYFILIDLDAHLASVGRIITPFVGQPKLASMLPLRIPRSTCRRVPFQSQPKKVKKIFLVHGELFFFFISFASGTHDSCSLVFEHFFCMHASKPTHIPSSQSHLNASHSYLSSMSNANHHSIYSKPPSPRRTAAHAV